MDTKLCRLPGVGFPVLAFGHCRDVVAAVSRSGASGAASLSATGD
jgi:hypothetical protein